MTTTEALTALDRCDRCGAQAQHRVTLTAGDLLFCEHHHRAHKNCLPQPTPAASSGQPGE
jgi:hypothetical protein